MANLTKLEEHLATRSYVEGYIASQADVELFKAIQTPPTTQNALRWYNHIKSYEEEFETLPGSSAGAKAFLGGAEKAAPAAAEEDEDDVDLFGSDDDDPEAAKKAEEVRLARVKEYEEKKAKKAKTIAKSVVTMDVKPWDDETDMAKLEEAVRSVEKPGLVWGLSKLVAIGYGIKKLQITLVIEDELVSLDELQEQIAEFEDYVQSSDIAAMQKL